MPEDATRRLLKVFGIAVTEFEDRTAQALERLTGTGSPTPSPGGLLALAEQWLQANGEVMARWLEVTRWLVELQARAQVELMRAIAEGREPDG
jgi:hypothetical protein